MNQQEREQNNARAWKRMADNSSRIADALEALVMLAHSALQMQFIASDEQSHSLSGAEEKIKKILKRQREKQSG